MNPTNNPPPGARLLEDVILPRETGSAVVVRRGDVLRLIEVDGKQVADVALIALEDRHAGYDAGQTALLNLAAGLDGLRRIKQLHARPPAARLLATVLNGTDTPHVFWNGGRCSPGYYARMFAQTTPRATCQDNLAQAVAPWGLASTELYDVAHFFMHITVEPDGRLAIRPPLTQPGDYVDLRAETDLLVAISACPIDHSPVNDGVPKRIGYQVWTTRRV